MRSEELQKLWWEWLGQSERVLRSLHEETAAIMLKEAERVKRIRPELDRMLAELTAIDERALVAAKTLADELGIHPDAGSLTVALGKAEAEELIGLSNRVKAAARTVETVIAKNRKLFKEELAPYIRAHTEPAGRAAVLMG